MSEREVGKLFHEHGPSIRFHDDRMFVSAIGGLCVTKDSCESIIENWDDEKAKDGLISYDNGSQYEGQRKSRVMWMNPADEALATLVNSLIKRMHEANDRFFGFDITGMEDWIQFTRYDEGCHFDWHSDCNAGPTRGRKLSFTLQLSDPDSYEGGDLEAVYPGKVMSREQGWLTFFPSFVAHRVTPVTKGTRYALVGWFSGSEWR